MQLTSLKSIPAGPAEGTVVARYVVDGMPGEGVGSLTKGARLAPTTSWTSLADAEAAVRTLTEGDEIGGAGIFRRDGRFEAYELRNENSRAYEAWSDSWAARTTAGRGLLTIIDGQDAPRLMSEQDFRYYERWAD